MAALPLREDYDGVGLRALAKASKDAGQVRGLLALALIYDGESRSDAAKLGGVGVQTIRDWVVWFNAEGPDGLIDSHAPGPATILKDEHRRELARLVDEGPIPAVHGVVRWRLVDLAAWLFAEHGITISMQTMSEGDAGNGLPPLVGAAAPPHAERACAHGFQKNFPARLAEVAQAHPGQPIEVWWQDEARIGQKNKITRRWAKRGSRPSAPQDQRTKSAYIFGAGMSGLGQGRRPRPAPVQYRSHGPAPCRDITHGRARRARRADARSGGMAYLRQAGYPRQHHPAAAAPQMPRTQPSRKRLAVHAPELAVEPRLRLLRTDRRTLRQSPGTTSPHSPGKSCRSG